MSVTLTNSKDIIANKLSLIQPNGTVVDIMDLINAIEGGLTPEQLQTLSEISTAINNDPTFFTTIQNQMNIKRNISDSYSQVETDNKINIKANTTDVNNTLLSLLKISDFNITNTSNINLINTKVDVIDYNNNNTNIFNALNTKLNISTYNITNNSLLDSINNTFNTKVDISNISASLLTKLNIADFNTTNTSNINLINNKVDISSISASLLTKLNITDFNATNTSNINLINSKLNISDFNATNTSNLNLINSKLNITDFNTTNTTTINLINTKVDVIDYNNNNTNIFNILNTKLNIDTYNVTNNSLLTSINNTFNTKLNISDYNISSSAMFSNINTKLNISDYNISSSAMLSNINNTLNTKLNISDYNMSSSAMLSNINNTLNTKLNISDYNISSSASLSIYDTTTTVNSKLLTCIRYDPNYMDGVARKLNLSGLSLFDITGYNNAMEGERALIRCDISGSSDYSTYTVLIDRLSSSHLWASDRINLASAAQIYTNTEETNFITAAELQNLKNSSSNLQTQINNKMDASALTNYYTSTTINSQLLTCIRYDPNYMDGVARKLNLSGLSLFDITGYNNAMEGERALIRCDISGSSDYSTYTVLIDRLASSYIWASDHIHLATGCLIYTNTADTDFINMSELQNLKNSSSNLQTQINNITSNINNLKYTKVYELDRYYTNVKFIKLGRLHLPYLVGHQAEIELSGSYGWNINNATGTAQDRYIFPNFKATIYMQTSSPGSRRRIFPNSLANLIPYTSNYDLCHSGYVVVTSPNYIPRGFYLAPVPSDNTNYVDIWYESLPWTGPLLLKVTQITGGFTISSQVADAMPQDGYVKLDMFLNNLTTIYKNPYNV